MTDGGVTVDATSGDVEARIKKVLALHFDPVRGAPYWVARAESLGFDPRERVRTVEDLSLLGVMDPSELAGRPLTDLLPSSIAERAGELVVAQTGGTLGRPAWAAYLQAEFEEAFVSPFAAAAEHVGFPKGGRWLYAGPSGPHIIGRAADALARRFAAPSPFMVDFDARWVRKLPAGSFGAERYLAHIVEQALAVIDDHPITVIFSTPVVLARLAGEMTRSQRERIAGVHYGGVALDAALLERFQSEHFPRAIHLSGYGNTLFGCCLELSAAPGRALRYFPHGHRLLLGVADGDAGGEAPKISYGEIGTAGRVVFTRLDTTMLLVNVRERDQGRLVAPPACAPKAFTAAGLESPRPINETKAPVGPVLY